MNHVVDEVREVYTFDHIMLQHSGVPATCEELWVRRPGHTVDKVCVGHVAVAGGRYDEMAEDEYQTTLGYDRGGMRERLAMCLMLKTEVSID